MAPSAISGVKPGTAASSSAVAELRSTSGALARPAVRDRIGTLTCSPSRRTPARSGTRSGSASALSPPAAAMAAYTRSPRIIRYSPGCTTPPLTWTSSPGVAGATRGGAASAAGGGAAAADELAGRNRNAAPRAAVASSGGTPNSRSRPQPGVRRGQSIGPEARAGLSTPTTSVVKGASRLDRRPHLGEWPSLVRRLTLDQEIGGSNPPSPAIFDRSAILLSLDRAGATGSPAWTHPSKPPTTSVARFSPRRLKEAAARLLEYPSAQMTIRRVSCSIGTSMRQGDVGSHLHS